MDESKSWNTNQKEDKNSQDKKLSERVVVRDGLFPVSKKYVFIVELIQL